MPNFDLWKNLELDHHFVKYFVAKSLLFKVENIITFNQKKEKEKPIIASFFMVFDIVICKLVQFQGA
jgi:hypothetical protein